MLYAPLRAVHDYAVQTILTAYAAMPGEVSVEAINICGARDNRGRVCADRAVALFKWGDAYYFIVQLSFDQPPSARWMQSTNHAERHADLQYCTDVVCADRKLTILHEASKKTLTKGVTSMSNPKTNRAASVYNSTYLHRELMPIVTRSARKLFRKDGFISALGLSTGLADVYTTPNCTMSLVMCSVPCYAVKVWLYGEERTNAPLRFYTRRVTEARKVFKHLAALDPEDICADEVRRAFKAAEAQQ